MIYYYFDIISENNVMRPTFKIDHTLKGGLVNLRCVHIEMKNEQKGIPRIQKPTDMPEKRCFTQLLKARWTRILNTYMLIDSFGDPRYSRIPLKLSNEIPKFNIEKKVYFEDYED
jgi:hypothetical protein